MRFVAALLVLIACEERPAAPERPRVAPVAAPLVAAPLDAGPPPFVLPPEDLDAAPAQGLPDDAPWTADDVRDAALQQLLLRDPDRLARFFEQLPAPSAFHVGVVAAVARARGRGSASALAAETPLPELPASGDPIDGPGAAFVGVALAEVRAPAKRRGAKPGAVLARLPAGAEVTVDALDGGTATVSARLAARVDFGPTGSAPTSVTWNTVVGLVPATALVRQPLDLARLATEAAGELETDEGYDRALVRWQRLFLARPSEPVRAKLLEAAWRARRPSHVAAAALERVWVTPRRARLAYACRGALEHATWTPPRAKLPADVCMFGVDARLPCAGAPTRADTARRAALAASGLDGPAPLFEAVVDASRARRLFAVSMPVRPVSECEEGDDHHVDPQRAIVRRLELPLGTPTTIVTLPVVGYHGVEHSVVGAQSEAKARDWLRSRAGARWTYDAAGEPAPSLGIGDTAFSVEADVAAVSKGRPPQLDCALCGGQDFR